MQTPFLHPSVLPTLNLRTHNQPAPWPTVSAPTEPLPLAVLNVIFEEPTFEQKFVFWGIASLAAVGFIGACLISYNTEKPRRRCGVCRKRSHNRATCPHVCERVPFPTSIPMSAYCECCGRYRRDLKRHHPRGRADVSCAPLDVCPRCHLHCCHKGHTQNFGVKPLFCFETGMSAAWRA